MSKVLKGILWVDHALSKLHGLIVLLMPFVTEIG